MVLVNTVKDIWEGLSQLQYEGSKHVQHVMAMVGYLSNKDFKNMVHDDMIPNFPVTLEDIKNSHTIFVSNVPSLKGEIVMQKPKPVLFRYVIIPKDILQVHRAVSVASDVVFINVMGFLVSISRHIKFVIVQYVGKRTTDNLSKSLENIKEVYYNC